MLECWAGAVLHLSHRMAHERVLNAFWNLESDEAILEGVTQRIKRVGCRGTQACAC